MLDHIKIEVPRCIKYNIEIRNELTKFIDQFNIHLTNNPNEKYSKLYDTYIHLDKSDIANLLNDRIVVLSFRIVGATRGGIYLHEIKRRGSTFHEDISHDIEIDYEIFDIEFIESTCFDVFEVYDRKILKTSKNELIGTNVTISFKN